MHISRRGFSTAVAAAVASVTAGGTAYASPSKGEVRGMWAATVENLDWPSAPGLPVARQRAELKTLLDTAVRRGLNTVILQVRPAADALWPSRYEPWSEFLTGTQGQDPGWDPLGTAVAEAHRRGLALHAWFNPYRVANHGDLGRLAEGHPARRRPEWTVAHGGRLYYNPGLPEVRRFVQNAILDAVRRYPIDGVHFDDYFYPYPVRGEVFDDDAAFARYGGGLDRAAWRRRNVDLMIQEMSARLHRQKPRLPFGVSPFGVWRNASTDPRGSRTTAGVQSYDDLHADTRRWIKERWVSYVCPQLYWNIGFEAADYAVLLPWWAEVVRGTGVGLLIGEGLYKAGDPEQPAAWQDPAELSRHLTLAARHRQVGGHVFFSAQDVAGDPIGAMARVAADHYR
ncbi:glycoside hydrolase family 10 protein [Streptomyces sp. NPDC058045]|uniref:glycoside hydrolase family 10 protein n=1 Tax=Streptomyces sp. NPDC058045 TaxID=3346311 RepID=UPI0036EDDD4C